MKKMKSEKVQKQQDEGYWGIFRHLPVKTQNAIFNPCPHVKYPILISDGLVLPKTKIGKKK